MRPFDDSAEIQTFRNLCHYWNYYKSYSISRIRNLIKVPKCEDRYETSAFLHKIITKLNQIYLIITTDWSNFEQ